MLGKFQIYTLRIYIEDYIPFDETQKNKLILEHKETIANEHVHVEYKNGMYYVVGNHEIYYATIALGLPLVNISLVNETSIVVSSLYNRLRTEKLNPMTTAFLYFELLEIGSITQAGISQELKNSQGSISNKLRLLKLPLYVQEKILNCEIKERHGRTLLQLSNIENYDLIASKIAFKIVKEKLKVIEVEDIVASMLGKKQKIRSNINLLPIDDRSELKNPAAGMIIEKINEEVLKTNSEITKLFPLLDIEFIQGVDGDDYVFLLKLKGINNG